MNEWPPSPQKKPHKLVKAIKYWNQELTGADVDKFYNIILPIP